jgi:hypothetical protein
VVEGTGLENRHTGEPGIESSNLSLSVVSHGIANGTELFAVRNLALYRLLATVTTLTVGVYLGAVIGGTRR